MGIYSNFWNIVEENNIYMYVYESFDIAKESLKNHTIVVYGSDEDGIDIYLTGFKDGEFGEYASWVSQEFNDNIELFNDIMSAIVNAYKKHDDDSIQIQLEGVYGLYFSAY